MRESKILYLDNDNNITDEESSVKSVIQVFENDILVEEVWSYKSVEEDCFNDMECVYIDSEGNVVPQDEATQVIYKTIKDGKVISENKFDLGKFTPKL
ncbi:MAG: hypothetical protein ACI33S_04170 [Bacilli bacterium]